MNKSKIKLDYIFNNEGVDVQIVDICDSDTVIVKSIGDGSGNRVYISKLKDSTINSECLEYLGFTKVSETEFNKVGKSISTFDIETNTLYMQGQIKFRVNSVSELQLVVESFNYFNSLQ